MSSPAYRGAMTDPHVTPSTPRARRSVPVLVLVCAALVVGLVVALPRSLPLGSGVRVVPGPGVAAPVPAAQSPEERLAEVQALLDRRGAAVRHDDGRTYAATQTASAKAPLFARVSVLPFVRWAYVLGSPTSSSSSQVVVPVRLVTRLRGEDGDAVTPETITLRRAASGWLVVAETTRGDRAALWELGSLRVVTGTRSLVIGVDSPARTLRAYAAVADRTVPQVSAVWGTGWSRFAVIVVPRDVGQLARALGRTPASLEGYAAVTTAEGPSRANGHVALRVWANTPALAGLSGLGREVVVRHELTHVATRAPERVEAPLWLVEGVAEWMGYRGSGIPLDIATGDLLDVVREGRAPRQLPTQADFDGDAVDVAYESAHLACAVLVSRYGADALVAVYRATVSGAGTPDEDAAAAVLAVTGKSLADLENAWRARARALALAS